eukprot:1870704-Rhodomonas_salina.1
MDADQPAQTSVILTRSNWHKPLPHGCVIVHGEGSTSRGGGVAQDDEGACEKERGGECTVPLHGAGGNQGLEETRHGAEGENRPST